MVVDQTQTVLAPIDQDACADLVDRPRDAGTVLKYPFERTLREDLTLCTGIAELVTDVFACP
jgi:hypothetical protein